MEKELEGPSLLVRLRGWKSAQNLGSVEANFPARRVVGHWRPPSALAIQPLKCSPAHELVANVTIYQMSLEKSGGQIMQFLLFFGIRPYRSSPIHAIPCKEEESMPIPSARTPFSDHAMPCLRRPPVYASTYPPSTIRSAPVVYELASLARYK